jgi:DNA-binding ferritin-like protein
MANVKTLSGLLVLLRAVHWSHWTSHWVAKGSGFYQDHLLFQRFYEAMPKEIDAMAEKTVEVEGEEAVGAYDQAYEMARILAALQNDDDLLQRALRAEITLLAEIEHTTNAMRHLGRSAGVENMLQGLSDAHETNLYLLKRRLAG